MIYFISKLSLHLFFKNEGEEITSSTTHSLTTPTAAHTHYKDEGTFKCQRRQRQSHLCFAVSITGRVETIQEIRTHLQQQHRMFGKYNNIYLKRRIPIYRHFKYWQICLFTWADRAPQTFNLCDSSEAYEVCSLLSVWGKWTQRERRRPTDGSRNTPQEDRRDEGKGKKRGRTADGVWWRAVDLVLLLCSIRQHEQEQIKHSERGEAAFNCLFTH